MTDRSNDAVKVGETFRQGDLVLERVKAPLFSFKGQLRLGDGNLFLLYNEVTGFTYRIVGADAVFLRDPEQAGDVGAKQPFPFRSAITFVSLAFVLDLVEFYQRRRGQFSRELATCPT